jgi:hypothetical protein
MKLQKIPMGKVEKWLVDEAKEVGLDIDGFKHEITNEFVTHVMNNHGDEKKEKSRGQIAIKQDDFNKIPDILRKPDITIVGAKRKNENIIIHAKKMEDGTTVYLEEVLTGRTNRTLRGKTMYKRKGDVDEESLKSVVTMNEKTDLSGAKIVIGGGGHSPSGAVKLSDPTVAASAHPADNPNIPQSGKKSSEIETARKAGYVQGVCECVTAIGDDYTLGKKLLSEMNVTKDMAKKYANPETYKTLEKSIFAQKPEQKLEQTQGVKR